MRHVGTLIAAAVIGPLAWILLAFGQDRSAAVFATAQRTGVLDGDAFVRPLQFLAVAGLVAGLITTLRFSPAGALLTGVIYVSSYTSLLIAPKRVLDVIDHDISVYGRHADLSLPVRTGTTLVLGALLLVWSATAIRRRRPEPVPAADEAPEVERPLGADGLGLALRRRPGPKADSRPEMVVRYRTSPRSAVDDSPHGRDGMPAWAGGPRRSAPPGW